MNTRALFAEEGNNGNQGQNGAVDKISYEERLKKVKNLGWKERNKIVSEIFEKKPALTIKEKDLLIDLYADEVGFRDRDIEKLKKKGLKEFDALVKLNDDVRRENKDFYYEDFTMLVSSFDDPKAIPAMLDIMSAFPWDLTPYWIIRMGEDVAVEPLLKIAASKDQSINGYATYILSVWVVAPSPEDGGDVSVAPEQKIRDQKKLNRIKKFFLDAVKNRSTPPNVRDRAFFGLEAFPDEDTVNLLEGILKDDTDAVGIKMAREVLNIIRIKRKN
ncbi:MAG: hypothetical protein OEV59_08690 [Deltaproteobacteria bacterium]|nr:hypothetical protein [Deltaproteobacteria bacterium]